jgi:hypothetical protein
VLQGSQKGKERSYYLVSVMGGIFDLCLKKIWAINFDIVSIFKRNAPLAKVVEVLGKLGKGLTKQDHIVTVKGPGNSLDRNNYYLVEKDVNFFAERTTNTNVGLVNLFSRYDKPWMNERVRRVNLRLDRALMGRDMAHIGVIDTASLVRDDYTTHGLHLNSLGKRRLTI